MKGPELVIGLIGAVGTDLKKVSELLDQELRKVNYRPETVRLSDLLLDCYAYSKLRKHIGGPEDERIKALMTAGDDLREKAARGDALALLAMSKIRQIRLERHKEEQDDGRKPLPRHAYILHSLKHPDEVQTLREVYGHAFVSISVYAPRSQRRMTLCERIAKSRKDYRAEAYGNIADDLIERDEKEVGNRYGQNVRDAFPESDVFVDATVAATVPDQIGRLIKILFSHPFITPTVDEYGLFHAKAAALRSADLSRQVGAVIITEDGEIIAAGCNEVPKAGGGAVWEGRKEDRDKDYRDFVIGHDSSARMKNEILTEILVRLRDSGWLSPNFKDAQSDELVSKALFEGDAPPLAGTRAASIIEFGRIVHAEMSAITDASRRGLSVKDAVLYCTTFPCHMCARHIIASGIKKVIYIEPYPKSMAGDLYKKSICVDHNPDSDPDAVQFQPFVGVSPRRYIDFFEMPKRKDARGYALDWKPDKALPRVKQYPTYIDIESVHLGILAENKAHLGIVESGSKSEGV